MILNHIEPNSILSIDKSGFKEVSGFKIWFQRGYISKMSNDPKRKMMKIYLFQ